MRFHVLAALLLAAGSAAAMVGGGEIVFEVADPGPAAFSHEAHVVGAGIGCKECHPRPYLDRARSPRVTMKEMEKGKSCGACHQGKRAFALDDCASCHR
jgi:c(7)-type cytochrome triheme protein